MCGIAILVLGIMAPPDQGAVRGLVRSADTGSPISYATVAVPALAREAFTDPGGGFTLVGMPAGSWVLTVTALGHLEQTVTISVSEGVLTWLEIDMGVDPVQVPGITARATRGPDRAGPGGFRIDRQGGKVIPALAEPDPLRAAQILPSVSAASDYSSALYVRGGAPDHTLVLLDGVPIFNPYHFGGLFGAFNSDAVDEVEFLPGALPAAYGDRLASVVLVHTRRGNDKQINGSGGIGLLSARLTLDGPLPGRGGTFLLSGRRSNLDLVGGGVTGEGVMPSSFTAGFQDLLLTMALDAGRLGRLSAVGFADGEWMRLPSTFRGSVDYDWGWGNRAGSVTLRRGIGTSTEARMQLGWTEFATDLDSWWSVGEAGIRDRTVRARGSMRDVILALSLKRSWASHEVTGDIQGNLYLMDYDSWRAQDPPEGFFEEYVPRMDLRERLRTLSVAVEDLWSLHPSVHFRYGARGLVPEGGTTRWGPRLGLRWEATPALSLSAGGGRYFQPLHSLRVEEAVATDFMSYDLLRPPQEPDPMASSDDLVVGIGWQGDRFGFRVDGYRKWMRDLRLPAIPADPRHAPALEPEDFRPGSGNGSGLEVLGQLGTEPLGVWLSYALMDMEIEIDGVKITPRYERRHALDLMTRITLPDGLRVTLRSLFATGQPTTPANGMFWPPVYDPDRRGFSNDPPSSSLLLGRHNSQRTPPYWRLDVGGRLELERELFGRPARFAPYVEIINLLNAGNVVFWQPSSPNRRDDPFLQLPLTLTAGLEWTY